MSNLKGPAADARYRSENPPPPYEQAVPGPDAIYSQSWDLACSPKATGHRLRLDGYNRPVWERHGPYEETSYGFCLDGFRVCVNSSDAAVKVSNCDNAWSCAPDTLVASALYSQGKELGLKAFGKNLLVYVQSKEPKFGSLDPIPEDLKNALAVKMEAPNVFFLTGTAIYEVHGDEAGFLVRSGKWLRLRAWENVKPIWCIHWPVSNCTLAAKHILHVAAHRITLYSRAHGRKTGWFDLPAPDEFLSSGYPDVGPVASDKGLIYYKTSEKTHYIFAIEERKVRLQMWSSHFEVEDPLVLRGFLDNLQLEIIGKRPIWTVNTRDLGLKWIGPIELCLDFLDNLRD